MQDSGSDHYFTSISWSGTELIATALDGVYASDDGVVWAQRHAMTSMRLLTASISTGSQFLAVGDAGAILSSIDGASLHESGSSVSYAWLRDVAWNGSQYIAVGFGNAGGEIVSSTNGIDWSHENPGTDLILNGVIWTGERFYAVGEESVIISSPEGSNWRVLHKQELGYGDISRRLIDIAWSGSGYAAVGSEQILTSLNGIDWSVVEHDDFNLFNLNRLVWTGTQFVAVGRVNGFGAATVTSTDGTNWTVYQPTLASGEEFPNYLTDISFNGEQFVAVKQYDQNIYTSSDGVEWSSHEHGIPRGLLHTHWTGSNYIGVGQGVIATSSDGIHWIQEGAMTNKILSGIASSGKQTVVVGRNGVILSNEE